MKAPFDSIAETYDSHFTRSNIGQLQRQVVWRYLERITPELTGLEILELNCGTGEDAVLFGSQGFNIIATDVSQEMLRVTDQKIQQHSLQHRISSRYLDLDNFDENLFDKKFDLVFSNFGGLNCIRPESIRQLFEKLATVLAPGGRIVAVVMPHFCLWESIVFFARFQLRNAFRRMTTRELYVHLQGEELPIWYYSPDELKKWTKDKFTCLSTRPVGFALPPSYMENFFRTKKRFLNLLSYFERKVAKVSVLAGVSDHFIIDLQVK